LADDKEETLLIFLWGAADSKID